MSPRPETSWTDADLDRVRAFAKAGESASEIASHFGGRTRNAVIGVCARRGISLGKAARCEMPRKPREPRKPAPRAANKPVAHLPPARQAQVSAGPGASEMAYPFARAANIYPTDARLVTLIDLEVQMCRWPIGEPRDPALRYCGADRAHARPGEDEPIYRFCPFHMKLGTQEGTKLRVRRETSRARAVPTCEREPDLTEVLR